MYSQVECPFSKLAISQKEVYEDDDEDDDDKN